MGHQKCVFDPFGVNGVDTSLISTAKGQTSPVSFKTGWSNPQYQRASNSVAAAVDIDDAELQLAKQVGADMVVNAANADPAKELQRELKGAHGVLVTAASRAAFSQALGMLHKRGTMSMVGLPPGDFALPIFDVVLNAKTVRGSIVGTRKDLQEALAFAGEGKVHTVYSEDRIENINPIFDRMRKGEIEGRVVLRLTDEP